MAALYVLTIINVCLAKLVRYGLFFFKKIKNKAFIFHLPKKLYLCCV